jgi:hypothetical protein
MLAFLLAILPSPFPQAYSECVDLIEYNHFFDEHARHIFDQVIFYDWDQDEARYNVRAWRLVKNPNQIPVRDWDTGWYSALWSDGEQLRYIRSRSIRETWTQYDPELIEREHLPKEKRRELSSRRSK